MTKQISLCPHCDHCPTVDLSDHEVHIGEAGNRVTLTPAEWNILVQAVKAGELTELKSADRQRGLPHRPPR
jgi:hypothetical protein